MGDLFSSTLDQLGKSHSPAKNGEKGVFKSANDLGHLPAGSSGVAGTGALQKQAQIYSLRHQVKGLGFKKAPSAKTKVISNLGRSIGRKRGY